MHAEKKMRSQRGLITRDQARALGLTSAQIDNRIRTGRWETAHRGVYRHVAAPRTWHQDVLAATLATGGVASHTTAATLLGIFGRRRPRPDITMSGARRHRTLPSATVHRTNRWESRQPQRRMGIPCTGGERTVLDLGAVLDLDHLERVAEEAVRRRTTSFQQLARFLVLHGGRGKPGSAGLRAVLLRRDPDASLPLSDFSRVVFNLIVANGLPAPVMEHRIRDSAGRFIMQADLAWPERKLIVELDGLAWHFGRNDVERDRRKRARARADGWRIMEVLWSMYAEEREELARLLADFLRE